MKQCRLVLRHAIAADHRKVFCNLLGKSTMNYNTDGGIIGTPGMTSRPLDFRTIDQRLAVNAYGGVHKAFYEDACEVCLQRLNIVLLLRFNFFIARFLCWI